LRDSRARRTAAKKWPIARKLPPSRRLRPTIRRYRYPSGRTAWCVDVRGQHGRRRLFFSTRAEARRAADEHEKAAIRAMRLIAEHDPIEVAQALAEWQSRAASRRDCPTAARAAQGFAGELLARGRCESHRRDWDRWAALLGNLAAAPVNAIRAADVEAWLRSSTRTPAARRRAIVRWRMLFGFAERQGWIDKSPMRAVACPPADQHPVRVYSPGAVQALLEGARLIEPRLLAMLAIGAFAGLRPESELSALAWDDVRDADGVIVVRSSKVRSARRRVVAIQPALAAWLLACERRPGPVCPSYYTVLHARRRLCARIGVEWIPDGLRHSFASYRLASCDDAAKVALELGHANTRMLFAHYRAVVTRAEAEAFWSIRPREGGVIVTMAQGGVA
jgi:site-specific recombinase XerD